MITGITNPIRQATLPLSIKDEASGQFVDFNPVVDTGFTGDLQLPVADIVRLNLPLVDKLDSQLADGRIVQAEVHAGTVLWFGNQETVNVISAAENIPLVGTKLLWGSAMSVEWEFGGRVTVAPLTPSE